MCVRSRRFLTEGVQSLESVQSAMSTKWSLKSPKCRQQSVTMKKSGMIKRSDNPKGAL